MNKESKTDWKKLAKMKDEDIDFSDIPELDEKFIKNVVIRLPKKRPITIRLDDDVIEWYKSQGRGYQTRINQLLRRYMETHQ